MIKTKNKTKLIFILSSLPLVASFLIFNATNNNSQNSEVNASSETITTTTLPSSMTIDLKDNTDEEIKNYYADLTSKSSDELSGTNLLKNLKSIISKNVSYYSYDAVSKIYAITDRDWEHSPASEIGGGGTYEAANQTVSNYSHSKEISDRQTTDLYLHALYVDKSIKNKFLYKGDGDIISSQVSFDKEHIWSQSHGFSDGKSENLTGAGSDLHHLLAGSQFGNRTMHNNNSYGFVGELVSIDSKYEYEQNNKYGTPLFPHNDYDQEKIVFEPQDSDKGDIARALLYMVACYNGYDDSLATNANPHLKLVNYTVNTSGFSAVDETNGYYGVLEDLLAWHNLDPVDEYEIHRNNLIYNNYQHNRNPFIDYPEWVNYIWGVSTYDKSSKTLSYDSTSTGYVDLNKDVINGYKELNSEIEVSTLPTKTTYTLNGELDVNGIAVNRFYENGKVIDVTNECTYSPTTLSAVGAQEILVTHTPSGLTTTFNVLVDDPSQEIKGTYYRKMTSSDTLSDGRYIVAACVNNTYYLMKNTFPTNAGKINGISLEVKDDKIDVADSNDYVINITKSSDNYLLKNDSNNILAYGSNTNLIGTESNSESTSQWSISFVDGSTKGSYKISNCNDTSRYLGFSVATSSSGTPFNYFGAFSSTGNNYYYVELFKEEQATSYAYTFLNAFTCDNGEHEPTFYSSYSWEILEASYKKLDIADQEKLTGATANENGTMVEQAVARYDILLNHWGIEKYPNFMNRNILSLINKFVINSNNDIAFVIIASTFIISISIASICGIKKRKKKEK